MALRIKRYHEPISANHGGLFLNPDFGFRGTAVGATGRPSDQLDLRVRRLQSQLRVARLSTIILAVLLAISLAK